MVVTPMEVIKIRLQAQHHSMADPLDIPKYRNAAHALYTVIKEEGIGAVYRGISLTALRQGLYPSPNSSLCPPTNSPNQEPTRPLTSRPTQNSKNCSINTNHSMPMHHCPATKRHLLDSFPAQWVRYRMPRLTPSRRACKRHLLSQERQP